MLRPIVLAGDSGGARAARTVQSLRFAGFEPVDATGDPDIVARALGGGAVWLVRAGAWLSHPGATLLPEASRTGLPLCALGRTEDAPDGAPPGEASAAWEKLLRETGGDLAELVARRGALPRLSSVYLEAPLSLAAARAVERGADWHVAVTQVLARERARVVRYPPLDVFEDPRWRVAQVVTSVQQGGAERVAIDLARAMSRSGRETAPNSSRGGRETAPSSFRGGRETAPNSFRGGRETAVDSSRGGRDMAVDSTRGGRAAAFDGRGALGGSLGVQSRLFAVWPPSRKAFSVPDDTADLSRVRGSREERFAELAREMAAWGTDLAHAHLFAREDLLRLAAAGYRPLVTVHNMPPSWPPGLDELGSSEAVLLVGCARGVERAIAAAGLAVPVRAVWNGIDVPPPADSRARSAARRKLGLPEEALILAVVANPRPQKRLHLLPAVLMEVRAALAERGIRREVVLAFAGNTAPVSPASGEALGAFRAERIRLGLSEKEVCELGSLDDVRPLLDACDVLVSPSAHEGLSLAHLEALAAGRPVIASGTGGTAELAELCPALSFVAEDVPPAAGGGPALEKGGPGIAEGGPAVTEGGSGGHRRGVRRSPKGGPAIEKGGLEVAAAEISGAGPQISGAGPEIPAGGPEMLANRAEPAAEGVEPAAEGAEPAAEGAEPAAEGPEPGFSRRFAAAVVRVVTGPVVASAGPEAVSRHFSVARMAQGYARLYPRAVARAAGRPRGEGLLLVTNNFSTGGAQSSARRLLLALAKRGVRVRAAVLEEQPAYPTPGSQALREAGIPLLHLPPPEGASPTESVLRLLQWIEPSPPRAVVFWNALAGHKVLLAEALFDVDVFDVSPGAMYFTSLQRFFANPPPGLPCRTARDYGSRLAGMIVKYEDERLLAATVLGAPVSVIPNGVPLPASALPSPPTERLTDPLVFGTAARIHPHKKLDDLLAAVRLAAPDLPPFRLRIAGGPDRGQEAYAADLRARNADLPIDWRGEVEETSASLTGPLAAFLATLDVFVLVAEPAGCPNASLEALAAGLPVIATNVGGMSEQIENGRSGRLVPRGDVPALARALIELANNAALRRTFAQAGQTRIANHFSMDRMVTSYLRVCLPP